MAKNKKPKGGRGCKVALLASALLLSSCTLQLEDKRIDPQVLEDVLKQHSKAINAIIEKLTIKEEKKAEKK